MDIFLWTLFAAIPGFCACGRSTHSDVYMPALQPGSCCHGLWLVPLVYHSALLFAYQVSDTLKCSITKVAISFQWVPENLLSGFISIHSFLILLNLLTSKLLKNKWENFAEGIWKRVFGWRLDIPNH